MSATTRDQSVTALSRRQLLAGVLSTRRPALGRGGTFYAALTLRLIAVGLLCWIGFIHLHLWQEGYKFIPTNGPLFLADAIVAIAAAAVLLVWARPLTALATAGFAASTLGALIISLTVGLFGFHESISASFVVLSIVIESVAIAILLGWTALAVFAAKPGR
jgi:hypothetical protein